MADETTAIPTTSPTQSASAGKSSGVGAGATAGIAIATFVVGLVVGGALLYFLWAKKRRNTNAGVVEKPSQAHTAAAAVVPKAGGNTKQQTIATNSPAAIIENNLPDPLADDQIISEFTKLDDRINGHVRSYYNDDGNAGNISEVSKAFFTSLGPTSSVQQKGALLGHGELSELLYSPQTRHAALRHALSRVLVGRIDVDAGLSGDGSLLPAGVAEAASAVHQNADTANDTQTVFITRWHAITHYLLGSHEPTALAGFAAVQQADVLLGPYASRTQTDRSKNLEGITQRAARLGDLLFSQPALWRFDWTPTGNGVVVFPGLLKLTDDGGRRLREPRVFVEKKVVQL